MIIAEGGHHYVDRGHDAEGDVPRLAGRRTNKDGIVVAREVGIMSGKDDVRELLENLPDDASLEDIQYHLYVRQEIQWGLEAAEEGRTITHEEAVRRMSRWTEK